MKVVIRDTKKHQIHGVFELLDYSKSQLLSKLGALGESEQLVVDEILDWDYAESSLDKLYKLRNIIVFDFNRDEDFFKKILKRDGGDLTKHDYSEYKFLGSMTYDDYLDHYFENCFEEDWLASAKDLIRLPEEFHSAVTITYDKNAFKKIFKRYFKRYEKYYFVRTGRGLYVSDSSYYTLFEAVVD